MSQKVFFFFDDSGVLHPKEISGYFVYGGYVFALYKIWICIINSRNCVNTFLFSFLIADLFVQLFYVFLSPLRYLYAGEEAMVRTGH